MMDASESITGIATTVMRARTEILEGFLRQLSFRIDHLRLVERTHEDGTSTTTTIEDDELGPLVQVSVLFEGLRVSVVCEAAK